MCLKLYEPIRKKKGRTVGRVVREGWKEYDEKEERTGLRKGRTAHNPDLVAGRSQLLV